MPTAPSEKGGEIPYQEIEISPDMDPFPLWNRLGEGWDLLLGRGWYLQYQRGKIEVELTLKINLHDKSVKLRTRSGENEVQASKMVLSEGGVQFYSQEGKPTLKLTPHKLYYRDRDFAVGFPIPMSDNPF